MLPFALLLVSTLLWPQAPGVLPTRWSGAAPDGFSSGGAFFSTVLAVTGSAAIVAALASLLSVLVPEVVSRWVLSALATVGGGAAAAYALAAWGTRLAGDPARVSVAWALGAVVLALAWGALAYAVHSRSTPDRAALIARIPERARIRPAGADHGDIDDHVDDQRAAHWSAPSASALLLGVGVFVLVVFAVCVVLLAGSGNPWTASVVGVAGLLLAAFALAWSRVQIGVDRDGLQVTSRLLPIRLITVAPEDILGVEVADLDPTAWGGWGLRTTPGRTAYIVSGGAGIVVHRANGTRLALEIVQGQEAAEQAGAALHRAARARVGQPA